MVTIPDTIAADPVQADIWRQIIPENNRYREQDLPTLELLVFWHAVAREAKQQLTRSGKMRVIVPTGYSGITDANGNKLPTMGKAPALTVLKEATAMIESLTETLNVSAPAPAPAKSGNGTILQLMFDEREKMAKAAHGA